MIMDSAFDWMLGTINQVLRDAGGEPVDSVDLIHKCGLEECDDDQYLSQLWTDAIEWGEAAGWFKYEFGGYIHLNA